MAVAKAFKINGFISSPILTLCVTLAAPVANSLLFFEIVHLKVFFLPQLEVSQIHRLGRCRCFPRLSGAHLDIYFFHWLGAICCVVFVCSKKPLQERKKEEKFIFFFKGGL